MEVLLKQPQHFRIMANLSRPSAAQLTRAAKITEQIEKLEAELVSLLGSIGSPKATRKYTKQDAPAGKKRVMSPEARKKIAEAQKRRWAKAKKSA